MDITKYNFHEELDNIVTAIEESTFLAIDGEFTGLDAEGCSHCGPLDTPEERYEKLRAGSLDFLFLQFGLCAFKFDSQKQIYEAKPYNFYIFPSPANRSSPDKRFLCQASSIDFLVSHGFDFNKTFKEGIPYLSLEQELKLKSALEEKHAEANNSSFSAGGLFSPDGSKVKKTPVPVPDNQKDFVKDVCEKITAYVESDETKPLNLPSSSAFQRKLVYEMVEEKFPLVHLEAKTGTNKQKYLAVHKAKDAEELAKKEQEKQSVEMMELDIQVGFSKVIHAITKSGKLVVGHNMFLDILHSVNHFHGPLPQHVDDFKSLMKTVFPLILDTKLLANTNPFKDYMDYTSLDEVRLTLNKKPFSPVTIKTAVGFEKYESNDPLHEAGYDAYVTGFCCATMCRFLGTFQSSPEYLLPTSPVVHPFFNKLFLMRIVDIPYLNLSGPDLEASRDHVFHVTFPKEWKASDLRSLFDPYGDIHISWLTDHTAYVSLHNKKYAKLAFSALSEQKGTFHVVSYAFHRRNKKAAELSAQSVKRTIHTEADLPPSKVQCTPSRNNKARGDSPMSEVSKVTEKHEGGLDAGGATEMEQEEDTKEDVKLFEESAAW